MYAIIRSGSKQYRVKQGDVIDVELLGLAAGEVEFKDVLYVDIDTAPLVGAPIVSDYAVRGEVEGVVKGPKVISYKFKRRQNYHRKIGHRQKYCRVRITEISKLS